VDTRRRTVGSLVMENAMALRPEPLCTPVLPQCPTVLKLAVANQKQLPTTNNSIQHLQPPDISEDDNRQLIGCWYIFLNLEC